MFLASIRARIRDDLSNWIVIPPVNPIDTCNRFIRTSARRHLRGSMQVILIVFSLSMLALGLPGLVY